MIVVYIALAFSLLGTLFGSVYALEECSEPLAYSYIAVGIGIVVALATLAIIR